MLRHMGPEDAIGGRTLAAHGELDDLGMALFAGASGGGQPARFRRRRRRFRQCPGELQLPRPGGVGEGEIAIQIERLGELVAGAQIG